MINFPQLKGGPLTEGNLSSLPLPEKEEGFPYRPRKGTSCGREGKSATYSRGGQPFFHHKEKKNDGDNLGGRNGGKKSTALLSEKKVIYPNMKTRFHLGSSEGPLGKNEKRHLIPQRRRGRIGLCEKKKKKEFTGGLL